MRKYRPWNRGAYKRFGFYMDGPAPGRPDSGIGWAVLSLKPKIAKEGEVKSRDPFAEAILMAHQAIADGAEGIDLYRYRSDAAFANSRAAAEGLTREQHDREIHMLAAEMRADGIPVNVLIVEE